MLGRVDEEVNIIVFIDILSQEVESWRIFSEILQNETDFGEGFLDRILIFELFNKNKHFFKFSCVLFVGIVYCVDILL